MTDNYESFYEEVWDYVSHHIVDDDMWEKHIDRFQELTFDLYKLYENGVLNNVESPFNGHKVFARIIESFVKNFNQYLK